MMAENAQHWNDTELDELLEGIYRMYHYDFRGYARSSLQRNVDRARSSFGSPTIADLLDRVTHDASAFTEFLGYMTIQVSDLFRDPDYFRVLRNDILPHLATYPSLKIWVPGCGAGEEALSIAIVLHEGGLLERSLIYGTDIDAPSLQTAETGTYDIARVRGFSENYFCAGGRASLADYYTTSRSSIAFNSMLLEHVLFSDHSLATDSVFAETHFVSCRNVLIYFDRDLQERAIGLFHESLCARGFLGLGPKETLRFSDYASAFKPFADDQQFYRML